MSFLTCSRSSHGRPAVTLPVLLALALAVLVATPTLAFTIYLKDGSQLKAKEPYTVREGRAYIILQSGTVTFLPLEQIDVERTRAANHVNLGGAVLLDDGKTQALEPPPAPASERPSLADLIRRGQVGTDSGVAANREAVRKEEPPAPEGSGSTLAGYPDLLTLPRRPVTNLNLAAELKAAFLGQGLGHVQIFQGSGAGRPLVEVETSSEVSVMRSLAVGAKALLDLRERYPAEIRALEILMLTPARARGGQFQLTPELASLLMTRQVDISTFFLRYVQF
jgi:hypothetical protein